MDEYVREQIGRLARKGRERLGETLFMGKQIDPDDPEHVLACYCVVRQQLDLAEKHDQMLMDTLGRLRSAPRRRRWNLFGGG